jgi:hypothetical protein
MWALFSARVRTWLFVAFALPVLRMVVRRFSTRATRRDPASAAARWSRRADSALSRAGRPRRNRLR